MDGAHHFSASLGRPSLKSSTRLRPISAADGPLPVVTANEPLGPAPAARPFFAVLAPFLAPAFPGPRFVVRFLAMCLAPPCPRNPANVPESPLGLRPLFLSSARPLGPHGVP